MLKRLFSNLKLKKQKQHFAQMPEERKTKLFGNMMLGPAG
jgi:hypothetical protein